MSEAKSNSYGVPQGSILGPILSNIFDDVQLLFSGTPNNLEQLKTYAETNLKTMKEWYSENGLKMNSNKTQCILFATRNFSKWIEMFQITIEELVRHMEDKVKNMGVIFDCRLSFEHHIKSLCSRLNGTLSYLNRVTPRVQDKSKKEGGYS